MQIIRKHRLAELTDGLRDCGRASYSRYQTGCRCDACRRANRDYHRDYARRSRDRVREAARAELSRREAESERMASAMRERGREEMGL